MFNFGTRYPNECNREISVCLYAKSHSRVKKLLQCFFLVPLNFIQILILSHQVLFIDRLSRPKTAREKCTKRNEKDQRSMIKTPGKRGKVRFVQCSEEPNRIILNFSSSIEYENKTLTVLNAYNFANPSQLLLVFRTNNGVCVSGCIKFSFM